MYSSERAGPAVPTDRYCKMEQETVTAGYILLRLNKPQGRGSPGDDEIGAPLVSKYLLFTTYNQVLDLICVKILTLGANIPDLGHSNSSGGVVNSYENEMR